MRTRVDVLTYARAAIVALVFTLTLSGTALAGLVPLWSGAGAMVVRDVGKMTNGSSLQALTQDTNTLSIIDLSSGQVLAQYVLCWSEIHVQPLGPDGRFFRDVDGDGRDEILFNAWSVAVENPCPPLVACLKYDLATGTLNPGPPPSPDSARFGQFRAFPNPANRSATISFNVPRPETATLQFFDVAGRRVKQVSVSAAKPGEQSLLWDGTDDAGQRVASGTYFYTVKTSAGEATKKIVVLH